MALPTSMDDSWIQGLDFPSRLFGTWSNDYELYEEDGTFVLTVEMPGYDPEDISVAWDDGVLNISAEHDEEDRARRRTYHRRFRFPKEINDEDITAEYNNGILEVTLPVLEEIPTTGKEIPIRS